MKEESKSLVLPVLAVACIGVVIAATGCLQPSGVTEENINWNLTLIGSLGEEKVLTFDELKVMPSYEGYGGFYTTVGMKHGPFECKGVFIEELCDLVGGIDASNTLWVSAPDGYLMVFTYDQVKGDFVTYDPETLKEMPHRELKLILMYKQDGAALSDDDGKPLRLAVVSEDKLLTEGHYWVKWVDKIEIKT